MLVIDKDLSRRFARCTDEELLRILTVERATYRREACEAAEMELARRGLALPIRPQPAAPRPAELNPLVAQGRARPRSPYQFIDFLFDVLLCGFVLWAAGKLQSWTYTPELGDWGALVYCPLFAALLFSATSLRAKWRAKEWRD